MSQRNAFFLFILILLVFTGLAFYRIGEQSLLYHDAGVYLLETKFLKEGVHLLRSLSHGGGGAGFWKEIKTQTEGVPLHSGKPGLNFIFWIASLALGLNDSLSAKVTAVSGIFGLILTFFISRKLNNLRSAVYSTALLASSVFYLLYSRAGVAEQVVTVFFLAGLLIYLHARDRPSFLKLFLAGFCLGYAFASNPWRVLYMPALLIGIEVSAVLFERKWNGGVVLARVGLFILGFLIPITAFELPYLLLKFKWGSLPFPDYWAHLAEKWGWIQAKGEIAWFRTFTDLGKEYLTVEGFFLPLLTLLAWIFLPVRFLVRKNFKDFFLWTLSFIPFFYFSSSAPAQQTVPRVVSSILPLAAVSGGDFLSWMENRTRKMLKIPMKYGEVIPFVLVGLILVQGLPGHMQRGITRSGYREASRYLRSTGEKKLMILGMEPVWRFYLGRVAYEPYNRPTRMKAMVEKARAENIRYVVADHTVIHSRYNASFINLLFGKVEPVRTFDNPLGGAFPYLLDAVGLHGAEDISKDPRSRKIYIFDIQQIPPALFNNEGRKTVI